MYKISKDIQNRDEIVTYFTDIYNQIREMIERDFELEICMYNYDESEIEERGFDIKRKDDIPNEHFIISLRLTEDFIYNKDELISKKVFIRFKIEELIKTFEEVNYCIICKKTEGNFEEEENKYGLWDYPKNENKIIVCDNPECLLALYNENQDFKNEIMEIFDNLVIILEIVSKLGFYFFYDAILDSWELLEKIEEIFDLPLDKFDYNEIFLDARDTRCENCGKNYHSDFRVVFCSSGCEEKYLTKNPHLLPLLKDLIDRINIIKTVFEKSKINYIKYLEESYEDYSVLGSDKESIYKNAMIIKKSLEKN